MKLSLIALAAIANTALAAPLSTLARAAAAGPVGFASQNGGTTGGAGGKTTTVTTFEQLSSAAESDDPAIIYVKGTITGTDKVRVGSNKSILGLDSSSKLVGVGLFIKEAKNVIVQNLAISKVLAENGDAIGVQKSTNVWIDHCDLSSDREHGKDYYDGLADFSHAADYLTVSNTYFHDHYKASLVGHSDSNAEEDTGKLHITYANSKYIGFSSGKRVPVLTRTQTTGRTSTRACL